MGCCQRRADCLTGCLALRAPRGGQEISDDHQFSAKEGDDAVGAALPFAIDPAKITVEPGLSYIQGSIKLHDYAAGLMGAFGSVVKHLGTLRDLLSQTMKLDWRRCGFHTNELQPHFLNGYSTMVDNWAIGPDNGTYRAKDGRYVTMIGLHPRLRDGLLDYLQRATASRIAATARAARAWRPSGTTT